MAMKEPVVLFNRDRYRTFQCTLYHSIVCAAGECVCGKMPKMGVDERGEFVRAEKSITLPARGYSEPLPPAVLKIPQVKVAMAEHPPFLMIANKMAEVEIVTPKKRR